MKIPVVVWKKVRRIQREFLWGSRGGRKRFSWVKWDTVCKPKKLGGLGVRDVRAVNISLLAKWRWRLLEDDKVMWKEVLKGKYGDAVSGSVILGENCKPWFSSVWWKDICTIGVNLDSNWFVQGVKKIIGNGNQTAFWSDIWLGSVPLRIVFPRLYSIAIQKDCSVADMRISVEGVFIWNFDWRRRLFVWEENLVDQLKEALALVVLSDDRDRWVWVPNSSGAFSVKSTYWSIINLFIPQDLIAMNESQAFVSLWNCCAPSKVQAFGWQLLLDRIPTRQNLLRRSINLTNGDQNCVCCGTELESAVHLFIYCDFTRQVWAMVFDWLGQVFYLPQNLFSTLNLMRDMATKKSKRQGLVMIWAAVIWSIWNTRNSVCFNNGTASVLMVVEEIKLLSWKWWLNCSKQAGVCLLYEWQQEPLVLFR